MHLSSDRPDLNGREPRAHRLYRRPAAVKASIPAAVLAALLTAVVTAVWISGQAWHGQQQRERGRAAFREGTDLQGRLAGHAVPLPILASRCINCHEALNSAPSGSSAGRSASEARRAIAKPFAAPLDRQWLTLPRSRHGGPPTAYNATALCELLRRGVDPGHVMISTAMPRYAVSDARCADLYVYLKSR